MSLKFGTSGLRGPSVDLAGPPAAIYSIAFLRHLVSSGQVAPDATVFLGRDYRDSSPEIAAIVAGALLAEGFRPVDCGALPTPALALHAMQAGSAALMITGSHIPADRNGIKFYRPDGEIDKADERAISALAATLEPRPSTPLSDQAPDAHVAAMTAYKARYAGLLPADAFAGLRIGIYQHSTVARDVMVEILRGFGAYVLAFGRSDLFLPVDTEAVTGETRALLASAARTHRLDAILSADGDGDRPLLADETGEPVRGDVLGIATARFLGADAVVTPVTSNSGIESATALPVIRTRVGSPFVIAGMQEAVAAGHDKVIGFEANGGLLTASRFARGKALLPPLPTRDCMLPLLATLAEARLAGTSLAGYAARLALPVADAGRLEHYALERSAALMTEISASDAALARFLAPLGQLLKVDRTDGLRATLADGRIIHLRPSGNAPEFRCYVEAETEERAKALLCQGLDCISHYPSSPTG